MHVSIIGVESTKCTDHIGRWCAHCFRYIRPEELDRHHMIPEWSTKNVTNLSKKRRFLVQNGAFFAKEILDWRVPVHRSHCHVSSIQHWSDAIGTRLFMDILLGPSQVIERAAADAFFGGVLKLAFVLWLALAYEACATKQWRKLPDYLLFAAHAAAGCQGAMGLLDRLDEVRRFKSNSKYLDTVFKHDRTFDIEWNLARGSARRNCADEDGFREARSICEATLEKIDSDPAFAFMKPAWLRRRTSVEPTIRYSEEALAATRDQGGWSLNTAKHYHGLCRLVEGTRQMARSAQDTFGTIFSGRRLQISWFHSAEVHLAWGIAIFKGESQPSEELKKKALAHCLRAQYISDLLDLRLDAVPGMPAEMSSPRTAVEYIASQYTEDMEVMSQLHKDCLEEVRLDLFRDLSMIGNTPIEASGVLA